MSCVWPLPLAIQAIPQVLLRFAIAALNRLDGGWEGPLTCCIVVPAVLSVPSPVFPFCTCLPCVLFKLGYLGQGPECFSVLCKPLMLFCIAILQ